MRDLTPREREIIEMVRSFSAMGKPGELVVRFDPQGCPVKMEPRPVYKLGE